MILIFGGTTEGRLAAEVCDLAGKPFWYSTKGQADNVPMRHGIHLSGAMDGDAIRRFCDNEGVRCIVNAAHPFAMGLHNAVAGLDIPVVRLQRTFPPDVDGATYCKDYEDAMRLLLARKPKLLLCLCGANSIERLAPYWKENPTVFRILRREESIALARESGFPMERLLFYNDDLRLRQREEEIQTMKEVGCDAVLTKESGLSGGFQEKAEAARHLGIQLFVIRRPQLPEHWTYACGRHSLRLAIERKVPDFFPLRTGLTTGSCATAATKAALIHLMDGSQPECVTISLPDGESVALSVEMDARGRATVVKGYSDDPDVTRGCRVWAEVRLRDDGEIHFLQGEGVGLVTLPGLRIPVGEPAINIVPRQMIMSEIRSLTNRGADVTIGVEGGAELAKRTFNPRLGVVGGISIVGTSGIVNPLSNEAFILSLRRELEVAEAVGCKEIAFVSGKRSEDAVARELGLRCIHCVNLIGEALKAAYSMGCFQRVVVGLMIGKAVKLAAGNLDTHSKSSSIDMDLVSRVARECGTEAPSVNFARELWQCMPPAFFERIKELCLRHCRSVYPSGELEIMLVCEQAD
ncbi:MAG: cobalt-precorrin-5B (C(1))-methyltransferase CbiD [Prevotellaceae bacterium]|nr:cobalt-precorrin-5B (C(1))-methyltransferase CbiD [Prevotellaceae bacterium]